MASPRERLAFERDVLFSLAGLDPSQAEKYATVHRLISELSSNVVPILRDYRDKRVSPEITSRALESSALVSSPQLLLNFVDELGPYVLGYTVARNKVRNYVEAESMRSGQDRWIILRRILAQVDVSVLSRPAPAVARDRVRPAAVRRGGTVVDRHAQAHTGPLAALDDLDTTLCHRRACLLLGDSTPTFSLTMTFKGFP